MSNIEYDERLRTLSCYFGFELCEEYGTLFRNSLGEMLMTPPTVFSKVRRPCEHCRDFALVYSSLQRRFHVKRESSTNLSPWRLFEIQLTVGEIRGGVEEYVLDDVHERMLPLTTCPLEVV